MTGVSTTDLAAFIQIFEDSDWDEADLMVGDDQLRLRKRPSEPLLMERGPVASASLEHGLRSEIVAPHIATFYRGSARSDTPLVAVGQRVYPETVVGHLAVLTQSSPLLAGTYGTILEICPTDAALVEYGEVLLIIGQDAA